MGHEQAQSLRVECTAPTSPTTPGPAAQSPMGRALASEKEIAGEQGAAEACGQRGRWKEQPWLAPSDRGEPMARGSPGMEGVAMRPLAACIARRMCMSKTGSTNGVHVSHTWKLKRKLLEGWAGRYNYIIRYPSTLLPTKFAIARRVALTTPWPSWRRPFARAHDPDRAVKHPPLHPAWMCCSDGR